MKVKEYLAQNGQEYYTSNKNEISDLEEEIKKLKGFIFNDQNEPVAHPYLPKSWIEELISIRENKLKQLREEE